MAKIFNVKATGDFSDPSILTRPLSTANANSDTGVDVLSINGKIDLPDDILSEGLPLKGIFLNINRVTNNANSLLAISLSTASDIYTTTYYTSALYKGHIDGGIMIKSQYWQGFALDSITIPDTTSFKVGVSCSSLTDIDILSDSVLGFNRYIIPENAADIITNSTSPSICIGNYIPSIESAAETKNSSLTANINLSCEDINIWSKSTLVLSTLNIEISGNIVIATDGNLTITPNTTALLLNDARIISINTATISAVGDYKQPYVYLTADTSIDDIDCNIDATPNWEVGDTLFFPGNTSTNTHEVLPITAIAASVISIENNFNNIHYSDQHSPLNLFNNKFNGAPVCNFTRNILISAQSVASFIYADNNSTMILHNIELKNLCFPGFGSVNISNKNTSISGCTISNGPAGIYLSTDQAANFKINDNFIYNCVDGITTNGSPSIPLPFEYSINKNIIANSTNNGIKADYTHYIKYNDNIIIESASDGISVNSAATQSTNIYQISGNYCFNCGGAGIDITDSSGTVEGNTLLCNERGVKCNSSNIEHDIRVIAISAGYNTNEGVYLNNSKIYVEDLMSLDNGVGILYSGVRGGTLRLTVTGSNICGVDVTNCNIGDFELSSVNVLYNKDNLKYSYPSQYGWNFFPTYITGGVIGSNTDKNCIVLNNTKCEKFVVNKVLFCSTGPNIKLMPAADSLIEGSYIFNGCLFTGIPFDDINKKYQTNVTVETGFCMMYDNNTKHYSKSTSVGTIESDLNIYHNTSNQISEKLTPTSIDLTLKSSKRLVYIDNFDGSVPPNLKTERLYADVWVKKSSDWNDNFSPQLIVAANPTLLIFEDTIIDTHSTNTTDWVRLSSANPIAIAAETRGVIELYVGCRGNSGGSINIDDWAITIV